MPREGSGDNMILLNSSMMRSVEMMGRRKLKALMASQVASSILKFNYTNNNTIIDNNAKIENLIDISNIPTESYQKYFLNNNNTINKRYIYKTSKLYEIMLNKTNYMRRNVKKFYLRKIKWPLGRKIKKYFKVKKEDAK